MKVVGLLARDMCLNTLSCASDISNKQAALGLGALLKVKHMISWKGHTALTGFSFPDGMMLNAILHVVFDWLTIAPHVARGENNSISIV